MGSKENLMFKKFWSKKVFGSIKFFKVKNNLVKKDLLKKILGPKSLESKIYWTIVPNLERYSYSADELIDDTGNARVVTVNKDDNNWKQILV